MEYYHIAYVLVSVARMSNTIQTFSSVVVKEHPYAWAERRNRELSNDEYMVSQFTVLSWQKLSEEDVAQAKKADMFEE